MGIKCIPNFEKNGRISPPPTLKGKCLYVITDWGCSCRELYKGICSFIRGLVFLQCILLNNVSPRKSDLSFILSQPSSHSRDFVLV